MEIERQSAFHSALNGRPTDHLRRTRVLAPKHGDSPDAQTKVPRSTGVLSTPRRFQALKGKTPADLAGIKVQGDNKWLTLIQNASLNRSEG